MGGDGDLGTAFDHMVVGNHITVGGDNEAGAAGNAGGSSAIIIVAFHLNRDRNHRIHIALINLARGQIFTGGQGSSHSTGRLLGCVFLHRGDLVVHLLGQRLHFFLPVLVHQHRSGTAAAQNQGQHQKHTDCPAKTLAFLGLLRLLRLRRYVVRFLLPGLRIVIVIIKIVHKDTPYCFFLSIKMICVQIMTQITTFNVFLFL